MMSPVVRRLAVALCAATGVLALWSASASAMLTPPYVTSFGSFSNVQGLAVDSATGDVYVYDKGTKSILKFDASGAPVNFSATGTNAITGLTGGENTENEIAVDNSSGPAKGDIYLETGGGANRVLIFNEAGTKVGQLTSSAGVPWEETCGVTVDPSGAVYVGIYTEINKYVPTANPVTNSNYVSSIGGIGGKSPCNVAADAAGDVFSSKWGGGAVYRYLPSEFGSTGKGVKVTGKGTAMAVDPFTDELYVDEGKQVTEFGPQGEPFEAPVSTFAASGAGAISGSDGMALSGYNHELYVSNGTGEISVFELPRAAVQTAAATSATAEGGVLHGTVNPEGVDITECIFEYGREASYGSSAPCAETVGSGKSPVSVHADVTGLEEASLYHFRLVVKDAEGDVWSGADETLATLGPIVSNAQVVEAGTTEVMVSASINPNGASTTYQVQYGETVAYGSSTPESDPVGSDTKSHVVSTTISGLAPGTTYHFRFVATNEDASAPSGDGEAHTYPLTAALTGCPNESLRYGYGALLPDCRAYEQVTPIEKDGTDPQVYPFDVAAAGTGGGFVFYSESGVPGGTGAAQVPLFLSSRGAQGWETQGLLPPATLGQGANVLGWSPNLSSALVDATQYGHGTALLARDNANGSLQTILPYAQDNAKYVFAGASSDGTKLFFEEVKGNQLTPEAAAGKDNLYVWDTTTETLSLVGALPEAECGAGPCAPAAGSFAGPYDWWEAKPSTAHGGASKGYYVQSEHAISVDGQKAYFTAGTTGQIYLRANPASASATTTEVSTSQKTNGSGPEGTDPNGPQPAAFTAATPDGSQAFFTSHAELTNDANTGSADQGDDLYRYEATSGTLTDLTPDATDPNGAEVVGVLGISEDGSYVYFAANGDLDGSGPATTGDCASSWDGASGECSLYMWHDGTVTFVARLNAEGEEHGTESTSSDANDWAPRGTGPCCTGMVYHTARVSADGQALLFRSQQNLTSYNSHGVPELYRYDAASGKIDCVTCNPSGAAPIEAPTIEGRTAIGGYSSTVPTETRNLSASGEQVFFQTTESLLPQDTNGVSDVYEWEADGAGTCQSTAEDGGCIYLLSTGKSAGRSSFGDASASGEDVYVFTEQPLVGQDEDELVDVYDVHVDGGLSLQNPGHATLCSGEACKEAAAQAPLSAPPGSASFTGAENVVTHHSPEQSRECSTTAGRERKLKHRIKSQRARVKKLRQRLTQLRHHGRRAGARHVEREIKQLRRKVTALAKRRRREAALVKKCGHASRRSAK